MTATDHTFASYRKPLDTDTGVSINGLGEIHEISSHDPVFFAQQRCRIPPSPGVRQAN